MHLIYSDFPDWMQLIIDELGEHPPNYDSALAMYNEARVFIIDPSTDINLRGFQQAAFMHEASYSMPFECIWVEGLNTELFHSEYNTHNEYIEALCIKEKSPGIFDIFTFFRTCANPDNKPMVIRFKANVKAKSRDDIEALQIAQVLEVIKKSSDVGQVANRSIVKSKLKGKIIKRRIGKVIICGSSRSTIQSVIKKPIDWSHKWEVRGHWRKCKTIGKDRKGEYVVKGFTWVTPHEKGIGKLVKKTRVFPKNPSNPRPSEKN